MFFLFADSDSSDEQQQYLLTAASMVGEAMDGLVSSLTQEQSSKSVAMFLLLVK